MLLGHQAEERNYDIAAQILDDLGPSSVCLMTNNPDRIEGLQELGINVTDRVPMPISLAPENAEYLKAKQSRLHHLSTLDPSQGVQDREPENPQEDQPA